MPRSRAPPPPPSAPAPLDDAQTPTTTATTFDDDVAKRLKRDGTLDALKHSAVEQMKTNPSLKTFTEFVVRSSATLRDPRARERSKKELIDALFRECEGKVLDEARATVWDALTDVEVKGGVGREAYVGAFRAAEEERTAASK